MVEDLNDPLISQLLSSGGGEKDNYHYKYGSSDDDNVMFMA